MKENNGQNRIHAEFQEFVAHEGIAVPKSLAEKVLSRIHSELNPSSTSVFLKLAIIHAVVGFATLSMCPQFGVSLTSSMGLMQYLMQYGESVCMFGCGVVFVGLSFLVASLALRPEQVNVIRRNRVLQISLLASISLISFVLFGGEVEPTTGMAWSLGAIVGGSAFLQLGWMIRVKFVMAVA